MAQTMTKKTTSTRTSAKKGEKLPADLDVQQLWAEFEKRFDAKKLPSGEYVGLAIRGFLCEMGEDEGDIVLNVIENEGWLDGFREYLDKILDGMTGRRRLKAIPEGLTVEEMLDTYDDRGGLMPCSAIHDFLDHQPDGATDLLIELIEEAGLEDELRDHLNNRLGHGPKRKAA